MCHTFGRGGGHFHPGRSSVDDIVAMGLKGRCDRFCENLNQFVLDLVSRIKSDK